MEKKTSLFLKSKKLLHAGVICFMNHKIIKRIRLKYPKLFQFFIDRFSLDNFTGLPLSFLLLAFFFNLLLLNELIETFINSEFLISFDITFEQLLFNDRVNSIATIFFYFTKFGSFLFVVPLALIVIVIYFLKDKYEEILPIVISIIGTSITVTLGKNYFHRIRPFDFSFYKEISFSFPSGHATIAVAFYGFLFYSIIRNSKKYITQLIWLIVGVLFIFFIGFSRLYLGVHYLTDVLTGYSLGFLWLLLSISIREWTIHKKKNGNSVFLYND